jgi:hypothetical protein
MAKPHSFNKTLLFADTIDEIVCHYRSHLGMQHPFFAQAKPYFESDSTRYMYLLLQRPPRPPQTQMRVGIPDIMAILSLF